MQVLIATIGACVATGTFYSRRDKAAALDAQHALRRAIKSIRYRAALAATKTSVEGQSPVQEER